MIETLKIQYTKKNHNKTSFAYKKNSMNTHKEKKNNYTGVTEFWTRLHSLSVTVRFVCGIEDKGVMYLKRFINYY